PGCGVFGDLVFGSVDERHGGPRGSTGGWCRERRRNRVFCPHRRFSGRNSFHAVVRSWKSAPLFIACGHTNLDTDLATRNLNLLSIRFQFLMDESETGSEKGEISASL